ncbi:DNA-binding protein [Undibacterium umbellatum]|uniref:DNA-binding protein n=1 Tax=Undibacterium umbellatum TaxID=2762300 RepID=A0ABR6ZGS1_9BURK|nr:DNA-binding protein [Undibacterium umbellatum]MBC3910935.1 DNA-binding protein [Undibacterium umbellatum]
MSTFVLSDRSYTRREAVWAACNSLAAASEKPSVSKVRGYYKGGSDTDVQADIHAWYERLFSHHCAQAAGQGMPDEVAELMRQLWATATAAAQGHLAHEKSLLTQERAQLTQEHAQMVELVQEKQRHLEQVQGELAGQTTSLAVSQERLQQALQMNEGLKAEQGVLLQRLDAMQQAIDERDRRHTEAMQLLSSQYQDSLANLNADHKSRLAEFEAAGVQNEQRYRGMERHMLQQIEEARAKSLHWEGEALSLRSRNQTEVDLVKSQLQNARSTIDASRGEINALKGQLTALNLQRDAMIKELALASVVASPALVEEKDGRQLDLLDAGVIEDELKTMGNGGIGAITLRETDPDGICE